MQFHNFRMFFQTDKTKPRYLPYNYLKLLLTNEYVCTYIKLR